MSLRVLSTKAGKMRELFGPSRELDLVCDWARDPDVCYAFESRAGAEWWRAHGGPPGLCDVLRQRHVPVTPAPVARAKVQSPLCFACRAPLCATLQDDVTCVVVKCGCRSRIVHPACASTFAALECVYCEQPYSTCTREGPLVTARGGIPDCLGSSGR